LFGVTEKKLSTLFSLRQNFYQSIYITLLGQTSHTSYHSVPRWPQGGATDGALPEGKEMPVIGQIAGVEITKEHVIIFHRGDRSWGAEYVFVMCNTAYIV